MKTFTQALAEVCLGSASVWVMITKKECARIHNPDSLHPVYIR